MDRQSKKKLKSKTKVSSQKRRPKIFTKQQKQINRSLWKMNPEPVTVDFPLRDCQSENEVTYVINAHGTGTRSTGQEIRIDPSILEDVNFFTLVDEGDTLPFNFPDASVSSYTLKYDICNCKKKLIRHGSVFNDMLLLTDYQSTRGNRHGFLSGVFICHDPILGISQPSLEPIISLEGRVEYLYDIFGNPIPDSDHASKLSTLISEIKDYHRTNFPRKSIKIIAGICLDNMSTGIEQITSMMATLGRGGKPKRKIKKLKRKSKRKSKRKYK